MHILVAHASKHSGTMEVAEAIAAELRRAADVASMPTAVDVRSVDAVDDVKPYDAVVLGSAVYVGRWLRPARRFVHDNAEALRERPVWLFSSGPVGDPLTPSQDASDIAEMASLVVAQDHRTFAGRLRRADLNLAERATVRAVRAAEGDYRDWDEVRSWAAGIADSLNASSVI